MTTLIQDAINMLAVSCEQDDPFEMIDKLVKRINELEGALQESMGFIDNYVDVVDGPDGPESNPAMSLYGYLEDVLNN